MEEIIRDSSLESDEPCKIAAIATVESDSMIILRNPRANAILSHDK